jgi:hypothetical protein
VLKWLAALTGDFFILFLITFFVLIFRSSD